jgi:hypothetical protein
MHPSRRPLSSHLPSRACGRPLRRRFFAQDKRNPRNKVRSAFACESRVRRSDDSARRAKASSPPSSYSDAASERTCARTDGNAAARPSCLSSRADPFPSSAGEGGAKRRMGCGPPPPSVVPRTPVAAKLSLTDSCSPHPSGATPRPTPHPIRRFAPPSPLRGEGPSPAVGASPRAPHIGGTSPSLPTSTNAASIEPSSCFGPRAIIAAPALRSV